uniref:Ig-like domain-containing protein n=1 Tax=Myotis lucifugus TaxID=59463 RepID=G1P6L8_MYOLU
MELLSAPICRGSVSWNWLLLAVSLLNFWSLPTTAQLSIVSTNAAEGQDVTLRICNMPHNAQGYMWYRGEGANFTHKIAGLGLFPGHRTGPAHSGREYINFDGSLVIKRVTLEDTGIYTVVVFLPEHKKEIGFGPLNVYERLRVPTLLTSNTTVKEHKDSVVLICSTNAVSIQWFFNGMTLWLTERMKLFWNDRILTIVPVIREDAGNYHCEVSNPISSAESEPVELDVKYFPSSFLKSPQRIHIQKLGNGNKSFLCFVASGPPAQTQERLVRVTFCDSTGKNSVVSPDVTQSTFHSSNINQNTGETGCEYQTWNNYFMFHLQKPTRVPTLLESNITVTGHDNTVVLNCYSTVILTQWFFNNMSLKSMKLSWNNRTLTIDPVRREDAGSYQCQVSNTISSAESEVVELDVKY